MTKTIIATHVGKPFTGYMVNAAFSYKNQIIITEIQKKLTNQFGDVLWVQPSNSLHITLLDWIAPLVEYDQDKDKLFQQIYEDYDKVISEAIASEQIIEIDFNTVEASAAAIILIGHDNGQFGRIRQRYLDNVELLPGTKLPPRIIHSTIARFREEADLKTIQNYTKDLSVDFKQEIETFRLIKETVDPLLEFELIKNYSLNS